jgi:hypothetical protein
VSVILSVFLNDLNGSVGEVGFHESLDRGESTKNLSTLLTLMRLKRVEITIPLFSCFGSFTGRTHVLAKSVDGNERGGSG